VVDATEYGTRLPLMLREALAGFSIAATIFLFTAFYILVEAENVGAYLASKVAPRYQELRSALEVNVRGVLYGAIYSTLVTQTIKSLIILGMNLVWHVPLAAPLAVVSFIIGFFPIVGSWSVYVPVAIWLAIFRNAMGSASTMRKGEISHEYARPSPSPRRSVKMISKGMRLIESRSRLVRQ
jgi:predicted PurR-regulated permease PerM